MPSEYRVKKVTWAYILHLILEDSDFISDQQMLKDKHRGSE